MKTHRNIIWLVVLTTFLMGGVAPSHAGKYTEENLRLVLDTWLHTASDALVDKWGPPESTFEMENGDKVFTYLANTSSSTGFVPIGTSYVAVNHNRYCKINFTVSGGVIVKYNYTGNQCKANPIRKGN